MMRFLLGGAKSAKIEKRILLITVFKASSRTATVAVAAKKEMVLPIYLVVVKGTVKPLLTFAFISRTRSAPSYEHILIKDSLLDFSL